MPTLADIYSAIGSAKRRMGDVLANPYESAQQMLGYANDRARVLNQMTAAAAQEGADYGPASRALGEKLAEAYNPVGMTVWHGSPHIFERFDPSKMGSGTGQQVYGKGLYMAESPSTANEYKVNLSGYSPSAKALLRQSNNDFDAAITAQQTKLEHYKKLVESGGGGDMTRAQRFVAMSEQNLKDLEAMKQGVAENKGALYKVDLPDTHVRRMLDWDAPLKNQPKRVRDLAKSLGMDLNDLGGDLVAQIGKDEAGKKILQDAGIPGVKYYNDTKGGPDTWKRNFVVFDPNHLTILERNSQPIK